MIYVLNFFPDSADDATTIGAYSSKEKALRRAEKLAFDYELMDDETKLELTEKSEFDDPKLGEIYAPEGDPADWCVAIVECSLDEGLSE